MFLVTVNFEFHRVLPGEAGSIFDTPNNLEKASASLFRLFEIERVAPREEQTDVKALLYESHNCFGVGPRVLDD